MRNLKPLSLSDKTLERMSEPTPADLEAARVLWRRIVPVKWKPLLDTPNASFLWDEKNRQYLYARTRKPIPFIDIRNQAIEPLIAESKQVQRALSERLQSGAMTLAEWEVAMLNNIKQTQLASAMAANGGIGNENDNEQIAALLLLLFLFFRNFAKDISTGAQALSGALLARSDLYANSARSIFEDMLTYVAIAYLAKTQERRILTPGDNCHTDGELVGCVEWAAKGWVKIGGTPPLGETPCRCITTPNSRVLTKNGWITLDDLRVGDLVYTHKKRWRPVLAKLVKPSIEGHKQIYIRAPGGQWIGATDTHLWLTTEGWKDVNNIYNSVDIIYNTDNIIYSEDKNVILSDLREAITQRQKSDGQLLYKLQTATPVSMRSEDRSTGYEVSIVRQSREGEYSMEEKGNPSKNDGWYTSGWIISENPLSGYNDQHEMDKKAGRQVLLQILERWFTKALLYLSLSMGLDNSKWSDTKGLSYSSYKSKSIRRPFRKSGIERIARTLKTAWKNSTSEGGGGIRNAYMQSMQKGFQSLGWKREAPEILFSELPLEKGTALYDITVEEDHSFLLEGLFSHNSNCRCTKQYR